MQWPIDFSSNPEMMENDSELACNTDDGPLSSKTRTTRGQRKSPASQVAIGSERTEDMVRTLNQQRTQVGIALLRDV